MKNVNCFIGNLECQFERQLLVLFCWRFPVLTWCRLWERECQMPYVFWRKWFGILKCRSKKRPHSFSLLRLCRSIFFFSFFFFLHCTSSGMPNVVYCSWCRFQYLIFFEEFRRGLHGYYMTLYRFFFVVIPLELQQRSIVLCARVVPMSLGVDIDLPC